MAGSDWPPKRGLSTPTTSYNHAILTISFSTLVAAPAPLVLSVLRDTSRYSEWNTWCPKVDILSQPAGTNADSKILEKGSMMMLHAIMDASKPDKSHPTQLRITDISTPESPSSYISQRILDEDSGYTADLSKIYRISWKGEGGFASMGLHTERFHEIIIIDDENCEVRTWEVMGGILARSVKWMFKKTLAEKFELWCKDLKKVSEERAREMAKGS
ncbi:hypothetical protein FKW77_001091 [Venturia effusa]|uniref:Uncharacterized protein n=1 Tax=Venturia effusa TaxID=50376 RepID=A0A517LNA5_9PEZI|nr:hypothetical protein FKW77_001091 [Venturia effusa]